MKDNEILRNNILEVVDNQLKSNNPPETKATYERLLTQGYSKTEAKKLIANVVAAEIYDTMTEMKPFNEKRYISRLKQLPDLSFLD